MTIAELISSLEAHAVTSPQESEACEKTISWIQLHGEFAFVKENLEGHLTGSIFIVNPERTKLLLMFHKKFRGWMQFGGHCDGEVDVENVAIREFHEESGIEINPNMMSGILSVQLWEIAERTSSSGMFQPAHIHYDLLFLGSIPEDTPFARQESEVDDIRWFDINGIEKYIAEPRMLYMIEKIKTLKNV